MQTFLPYADFRETAKCLDYKRLGKQRLEAKDCLYVCYRHKERDKRKEFNYSDEQADYIWKRYKNHLVVKLWINHTELLKQYYNWILFEWINRGYNNNMKYFDVNTLKIREEGKPFWMDDVTFHNSHKSNLLRKKPEYYEQFNWNVPNNLPYVWRAE